MMGIGLNLRAQNERAMRAFCDGMERADAGLLGSSLHPDVIFKLPQPTYTGRVVRGAVELTDFIIGLATAAYSERRATYGAVVADDAHGVAEWRLQGTLTSGGDYDQYYCWLFDFDDGRITEIREYIDTEYGARLNGRVGGEAVDAHAIA